MRTKDESLFDAIAGEDMEEIRMLLEANGDCTLWNNCDENPLQYAALQGNFEAFLLMLEIGEIMLVRLPMLVEAACGGNLAFVEFLIHHKADPNTLDERGWTPLKEVAYWGYADIVDALIEASADVSTKMHHRELALSMAKREGHSEIIKRISS